MVAVEQLLTLLIHHRYLVLFPLAIVEGPIVAVIAGWLCHEKLLSLPATYPILVAGDLIGDTLIFLFCRNRRPREQSQAWQRWVVRHPLKSIAISKLTLGIGPLGLAVVVRCGLSYRSFLGYVLLVALGQYVVYLSLGFAFGAAYHQINHYLQILTLVGFIGFVLIVSFLVRHQRTKTV